MPLKVNTHHSLNRSVTSAARIVVARSGQRRSNQGIATTSSTDVPRNICRPVPPNRRATKGAKTEDFPATTKSILSAMVSTRSITQANFVYQGTLSGSAAAKHSKDWNYRSLALQAYRYGLPISSFSGTRAEGHILDHLIRIDRSIDERIDAMPLKARKLFSKLYTIPAELRLRIFEAIVVNDDIRYHFQTPAALQVSRQCREELLPIFISGNTFAFDMTNPRGIYMPSTSRIPTYLQIPRYSTSLWEQLATPNLPALQHLRIYVEWAETENHNSLICVDIDVIAGGNTSEVQVRMYAQLRAFETAWPLDSLHDRGLGFPETLTEQSRLVCQKVKKGMETFLKQVAGRAQEARWVESDLVGMKTTMRYALKAEAQVDVGSFKT